MLFPAQRAHGFNPPNPLGLAERVPRPQAVEGVSFYADSFILALFGSRVKPAGTKIRLPLASPAIASVSIFNFLTAWEEYPWANTVINDNSLRTLPIAIAGFFGQHQFTCAA